MFVSFWICLLIKYSLVFVLSFIYMSFYFYLFLYLVLYLLIFILVYYHLFSFYWAHLQALIRLSGRPICVGWVLGPLWPYWSPFPRPNNRPWGLAQIGRLTNKHKALPRSPMASPNGRQASWRANSSRFLFFVHVIGTCMAVSFTFACQLAMVPPA